MSSYEAAVKNRTKWRGDRPDTDGPRRRRVRPAGRSGGRGEGNPSSEIHPKSTHPTRHATDNQVQDAKRTGSDDVLILGLISTGVLLIACLVLPLSAAIPTKWGVRCPACDGPIGVVNGVVRCTKCGRPA